MVDGIGIRDLYKIILVTDPKISPDMRHTLFTVTRMDEGSNRYVSRIWVLDEEEGMYEPLTNGPSDNSPEWSPDSRRIAFLSRRRLREGEHGNELWIYNFRKRYEMAMLLSLKGGIENIRWSPDGKRILFTSAVYKMEEDVKVIEEIPIWFNEKGYTYNSFTHLFIVDVDTGNYVQLTKGKINITYAEWLSDYKHIAYIASTDLLRPYIKDIYIYDVDTGFSEKLTDGSFSIWDLDPSKNDKYIAFRGNNFERGLSTSPKIWLLDINSKEIKLLFKLDRPVENAMNSDVRGISSSKGIKWMGRHIYFPVADAGAVYLYRVDAEGNLESMISGNFVVDDFSVSEKYIMATLMTSTQPPEIYRYDGELKKVTDFNRALFDEVKVEKPVYFKFRASDGVDIDGWVLKPIDFDRGKRYPAIVEVHGGPSTAYGEGFMHEFHVLSSRGFTVVYMNPRGSSGYSQDFRDIRVMYGERDYMDIMEGLDYVLKRFSFIDSKKLGIIGGSYGGFMTNWIIGHTDRFKAAVTQRSISNWISDYGTTDIGFYFDEDQIAGGFNRPFWEDMWFDKYWKQSPIQYVNNVKTPLLIIHSLEDYRCWLDQALQMFTALKRRGIPVRLVLFPKENHNLSRKGKPKHREKRLEEIVAWFEKYLKK